MRSQTERETEYGEALATWSDIRDYLPWLREEATHLAHPAAAELGVRTGRSTTALLAGAGYSGARVWSVDINPPDVPNGWFLDPVWNFAQCDSTSAQAQVFIPPAIGLLLVDTAHDYATTCAELGTYGPRVVPGGVIACHDTQWADGDIDLGVPEGPVAVALTDYCDAMGWGWENLPGSYGLGVVRVPEVLR